MPDEIREVAGDVADGRTLGSSVGRHSAGRLKQFLILSLGAVMAAVMGVLGVWQMQVYRNDGGRALLVRSQRTPVPLTDASGSLDATGRAYGLNVWATGTFLPAAQVLVGTDYPLRVATAFRLTNGQVLVVVRGQVDAGETVPKAPARQLTLTGVLLAAETPLGTAAAVSGRQTADSIRPEQLAQSWPGPLIAGFITLSASESVEQGLRDTAVTLPSGSGSAQNLGYAMQWWAFAGFTVVGSIVWARTIGRQAEARTATGRPGAAG